MKALTQYLWAVFLLWFSLSQAYAAAGSEWPRGVAWKQITTGHFVILFAEQHTRAAQRVAYAAEAVHADMAAFFGIDEENGGNKQEVIIIDQSDVVDLYKPVLAGQHEIVLNLPSAYAGRSTAFNLSPSDSLIRQFIHQYAAIMRHDMDGFFREILSIPFPDAGFACWMECGMAVLMERMLYQEQGEDAFLDMVLRTEVLENRLTSLKQQASLGIREWPGDIGIFAYGASFLKYLTETYGPERLAKLNQAQSATDPLFGSDAFEAVYGISVDDLEEQWRTAVRDRYALQIKTIQRQPVTSSTRLSMPGRAAHSPVFSPDGQFVYYIEEIPDETPRLVQLRLTDYTTKPIATAYFSGDFAVSPDGSLVCFSKTEIDNGYYEVSDLHCVNPESLDISRLTRGEHAFDPVFTPDGAAVIYTTSDIDASSLVRLHIGSGKQDVLLTSNDARIGHPAVSPDGTLIAVELWQQGDVEDMYLMSSDGADLRPITHDLAIEASPCWGPGGDVLYFSSDRGGVSNIYAYSLRTQELHAVTNVLTGAFDPAVSADGTRLAFDVYGGDGLHVHIADLKGNESREPDASVAEHAPTSGKYIGTAHHEVRGYNPLASLVPEPGPPALKKDAEGYMLGFTLSGKDILELHHYALKLLYGLKSEDLAYEIDYTNAQFPPTIHLFGSNTPGKYSHLFRNADGEEENYFERRQEFGVNIAMPVFRTHHSTLSLLAGYDYQTLSSLTEPATLNTPLPAEGTLGSVSAGVLFDGIGKYRYVDEKAGTIAQVKYSRYDEALGSDFTIDELTGELDVRLKMPVLAQNGARHHRLRLRIAGGLSEGDTLEQGLFQLGGFMVNSPPTTLNDTQFFLRGYDEKAFAGDRIVAGTVEYRIPICFPQRAMWNGRLFFDSLTATVFYETGDAWKHDQGDFDLKHSVGGHLTLNVGASYGKFPVSASVGLARGLDDKRGESHVYFIFGIKE